MHKYASLWLLGALLISGCASGPAQKQTTAAQKERPDWITKPPLTSGMAYGVGSMDVYGNPMEAVQRATELARVDLVTQLKVTVGSNMQSNISESSGSHQGTQMLRTIHQHVSSSIPEAELDDVQTLDTWVDTRHAYVLTVLDRNQAASRLRNEIQSVDEELLAYSDERGQGNTLQQVQPLLPALTLFAKREKLSERLALVSMDRRGSALSPELQELEDTIDDLIDELVVTVKFMNTDAQNIGGDLIEALTKQGLRVSQYGTADLVFAMSTEITYKVQNKSHYVFANSRITIYDNDARALNTFSKQGKGVSGLETLARQKAAQNVAQLLSDELAITLVDRLD